jgi:beta-mannosidase
VDQSLLNYEALNLVLHGIDTISDISINNVLIGSTNNMFVRYKFGIKKHLKVGDNKITIAIKSPVNYVNVKNAEQIATKYPLPPSNKYSFYLFILSYE